MNRKMKQLKLLSLKGDSKHLVKREVVSYIATSFKVTKQYIYLSEQEMVHSKHTASNLGNRKRNHFTATVILVRVRVTENGIRG